MITRLPSDSAHRRGCDVAPLPRSRPLGDRELIAAGLLALACLTVSYVSLLAIALLAADIG